VENKNSVATAPAGRRETGHLNLLRVQSPSRTPSVSRLVDDSDDFRVDGQNPGECQHEVCLPIGVGFSPSKPPSYQSVRPPRIDGGAADGEKKRHANRSILRGKKGGLCMVPN